MFKVLLYLSSKRCILISKLKAFCRFTIQEVIQKASELLKDHAELIPGFNVFLPADHKIEV